MLKSNTNFIRMWTHCTVEKVETIASHEQRHLRGRVGVNKKVLNHSCHWKTNSVEFAASRDFGLELNCKNLTTQDRQLFKRRQTWHVLKKKTGQRRYLLQRAKKFLSLKVRTVFYNSLIQQILDYWVVDKQAT